MKKRILIMFISLVCIGVHSILVIAENRKSDIEFPILTNFNLEVFRKGRLTEKKMLVNLEIFKFNGSFHVSWNHVHIEPLHSVKKVYLNARHFSTSEGTIKNVIVGNNGFSFRLEHLKNIGLTADVIVRKREGQNIYSVEASATDFILGRRPPQKTTEIWQTVDKQFVLPYKEVY